MNLDDLAAFAVLDPHRLMDRINRLPDRFEAAWQQGLSAELLLPPGIRRVLLAAVGEGATSAGLAAAYCAVNGRLPVITLRDYDIPAWGRGPESLLVAISHSGDAEETATALEQAVFWGCPALAVTGEGRLAEHARGLNVPVWLFAEAHGDIGCSLGLLLALLHRLDCIADPNLDVREALHALRNQQTNIQPETPTRFNPAKRMAGQLIDRWVTVFVAERMAPVAKHWKDAINTLAKSWGQFDVLPEADHNSLLGLVHPESTLTQMVALFLTAPSNHPRNQQRLDLTRRAFMVQGVNTDFIPARGETLLAHLLTLTHFADYTAYYLAMAYQEDPAQVEILDDLKQYLRDQ